MAKTVKRIVVHPKLYMRVEGKLQHVPPGTELTVTEAQCENSGKRLADPAEQKKLDTTAKNAKVTEGEEAASEAVKKLTTDLEAANTATEEAIAETKKAQDALVTTATDLEAANTAVKKLTAENAKLKK